MLITPEITCRDSLGRYYTDFSVSKLLISEMKLVDPEIIVDFGTGSGSLINEAIKSWDKAKFVTVDIDKNIQNSGIYNLPANLSFHFTQDVLRKDLHSLIGVELGTVDAAVCNPPYIRPEWKHDFEVILQEAGLSSVVPKMKSVGADILFIAQNLRFLKDKGCLGLILPDGIIAGARFKNLRKNLLSNHRIESVIELPRKIFQKTDAKAHILILTKSGDPNQSIRIQNFSHTEITPAVINISPEEAVERMDFSFYKSNANQNTETTKTLITAYTSIQRGKLSSTEVRMSKNKIFHSTNFPDIVNNICPEVPREFISDKKNEAIKTVFAEKGDILLCRVGRNLEKKICYVPHGFVALSDCVYKLSVKDSKLEKVKKTLCSAKGKAILNSFTHGVGAKYLTVSDLLKFPI